MGEFDTLIKAWDDAHWELSEAFVGLPDHDVWVRPHPRLLSIGELAAHVAYSEALHFTGGTVVGPLTVHTARYYPYSLEAPLALPLGAEAVYAEVARIHAEAKARFLEAPHTLDEPHPEREGWTCGYLVEYMAFHTAYHTGQIYSVRHLLGHEPVDN